MLALIKKMKWGTPLRLLGGFGVGYGGAKWLGATLLKNSTENTEYKQAAVSLGVTIASGIAYVKTPEKNKTMNTFLMGAVTGAAGHTAITILTTPAINPNLPDNIKNFASALAGDDDEIRRNHAELYEAYTDLQNQMAELNSGDAEELAGIIEDPRRNPDLAGEEDYHDEEGLFDDEEYEELEGYDDDGEEYDDDEDEEYEEYDNMDMYGEE
ncbi:MAG: hypothetical protein AAF518_14465 [Spirochaetota bacterium]